MQSSGVVFTELRVRIPERQLESQVQFHYSLFYASEDQLTTYIVGFLGILVQPSAASSSNRV